MRTKEEYFSEESELIGTSTLDFGGPIFTGGKGAVGHDLDGRKFLDFTSQVSLLNTGHQPKEVVSAIEQMARKYHSGISADWPYCVNVKIGGKKVEISRVALAKRLIDITKVSMPFKKRVFFEVSGATAVNAALKIAKINFLKKRGIVSEDFREHFGGGIFIPSQSDLFKFSILTFSDAFNGRHAEAQCLTNSKIQQMWAASSSCAFGRLPFPKSGILGFILRETDRIIHELEKFAPVVAFVFEPVQGEGGINIPDGNILPKLVEFLRNKDIAIIADEVQAGFGRTGKMFACEHFGIQPDMMVLSKSLGAGIPLGAVVVDAKKFRDLEPGMHSGSHHATPLAVAGAIANIDLILKKNLVMYSAEMGKYLISNLRILAERGAAIREVRGLGLMVGIDFHNVGDRNSVVKNCEKEGLLVAPAGTRAIRMTPPLVVTMKQIDKALRIFDSALKSLYSFSMTKS